MPLICEDRKVGKNTYFFGGYSQVCNRSLILKAHTGSRAVSRFMTPLATTREGIARNILNKYAYLHSR